ncbi:MAG: hypothetical protein IPP87_01575 [Ideonella sp.]|nr:hypothetical protein [Ideonella sp.]
MLAFQSHLIERAPTPPDAIDRVLQCMAGFFGAEADAQQAVRRLQHDHQLAPAQVLLLAPRDGTRFRFARRSRDWARRWPKADAAAVPDRALGALAGAVLGAAASLLWISVNMTQWDGDPFAYWVPPLAWSVAAMVLTAGLGAGLVQWFDGTQRPQRFNGHVQRQLVAGHWAVVVHNVPWTRQAEVLSTIQQTSQLWSASAQGLHRL